MDGGEPASGDDRRYLLVSLILSLAGGFADAGSLILVGSFTGHLTGNLVLAAVHAARGEWGPAASCLAAVAAFLAGTVGGVRWPHAPGRSARRQLAGPVAAEMVLIGCGLAAVSLFGTIARPAFLACLCFALGLQNGALGRIGSVPFHTTFITGLSTSLVAALAAGKPSPKRRLLPAIIGCFIAGAALGAFVVARLDEWGFAGVLLLLGLGWLLCRLRQPAPWMA